MTAIIRIGSSGFLLRRLLRRLGGLALEPEPEEAGLEAVGRAFAPGRALELGLGFGRWPLVGLAPELGRGVCLEPAFGLGVGLGLEPEGVPELGLGV